MKIKNVLCAVLCMCLLSGCSGQQQGTESGKPESAVNTSGQAQTTTTAPTAAAEEKHSSPEKAIEEYCKTFSDKNIESCKKIVPPDYLYYIDANKEENPNAGWWVGSGENNSDKIRVTEFKSNIELEKGEEMYEWYLNYYTAIKSTNAEKITMYTTSAVVSDSIEEEQTADIQFFCVLEEGKWYAIIAD